MFALQPWNPTIELRPLRKGPAPSASVLYQRVVRKIPEFGKPISYDLVKKDWLPPLGKGEVADFILKVEHKDLGKARSEYGSEKLLYDDLCELTFSNPGDGIQPMPDFKKDGPLKNIAIDWPREAPESGYGPRWTRRVSRIDPNKSVACDPDVDGPQKEYLYRVRTSMEDGKIVGGLYGSLGSYLPFGCPDDAPGQTGYRMEFVYYLNLDPGSRNLEFNGIEH